MIPGTVVKHFKGGVYIVIGEAKHSTSGEELIIYRGGDGELWARPKAEFLDGRFTPLDDSLTPSMAMHEENHRGVIFYHSVRSEV